MMQILFKLTEYINYLFIILYYIKFFFFFFLFFLFFSLNSKIVGVIKFCNPIYKLKIYFFYIYIYKLIFREYQYQ